MASVPIRYPSSKNLRRSVSIRVLVLYRNPLLSSIVCVFSLRGIRPLRLFYRRLLVRSLRISHRYDCSACYGFRIFCLLLVHRCSVWASSFGGFGSGSSVLDSESEVSVSEAVSSTVRSSSRSFRPGLVRSPDPIAAVSFVLGTKLPSDSSGLVRT